MRRRGSVGRVGRVSRLFEMGSDKFKIGFQLNYEIDDSQGVALLNS